MHISLRTLLVLPLLLFVACDRPGPSPVPAIARMSVPTAPPISTPAPPRELSRTDRIIQDLDAEAPASVRPSDYLGTWKATVTSARMEGTGAPLSIPLSSDEPFSLMIVERAGQYFVDGPSPLELKADGLELAGQSGIVQTRLALRDRKLLGEWIRSGSDGSLLVVEFTAVQ